MAFYFYCGDQHAGIRYSHPETQRIGQPFKGDDILLALQGKENVAINRGFLAKALRVFTPVYDEHHRQDRRCSDFARTQSRYAADQQPAAYYLSIPVRRAR